MTIMQQHRAIVRQPSPLIADGQVTHIDRQPMDVERAFAQHRGYVAMLASFGFAIIEAPAVPEHPDGVFIEDALVMIDDFAVVTRPGAPTRRGEVSGLPAFLRDLGLGVGVVGEPAIVDGGDVLVTPKHIFVGLTTRSNADGVAQFGSFGAPLGRVAHGAAVSGCLHLKSAITELPDGSLITVPGWIDREFFEDLGYVVHDACELSGGDVLSIGNTVILPADAPDTAAMLRTLGFDVAPIDVSELQKIEAGVTCMSVLI